MKMKTTKITGLGLGSAIFFSGISVQYSNLSQYPMGILLMVAGLIVLSQVAFKELVNKKVNTKDATNVISLLLGVITFVAGLFAIIGLNIPSFLVGIVPFVVVIVGILIFVNAIRD